MDRVDTSTSRWFQENRWLVDAALAAGLLVVAVLGAAATQRLGPLTLLFNVLLIVPLAWRRTEPEAVLVITVFVCLGQLLLVPSPQVGDLAVPVVVHAVSAYSTHYWRLAGLLAGIAGAGLAALVWVTQLGYRVTVVAAAAGAVSVIAAFLLGQRQRDSRDRLHEQAAAQAERTRLITIERDQRAEMSAASERARIARELHDIVAHSLSVIVVQADGGIAASRTTPEVAPQVLATIADTSRDALGEMRRLVGVLRAGGPADSDHPDYAPAPGAADVADLVEQVRRAGVSVDLVIGGTERPLGPAVGLTLFRVVQESLTNVIKHAGPAARAEVSIHYGIGEVMVTVLDDGRGAAAIGDDQGNGLLGMRERVELQGGTVAAQPRPGGGFLVTASIPAPPERG